MQRRQKMLSVHNFSNFNSSLGINITRAGRVLKSAFTASFLLAILMEPRRLSQLSFAVTACLLIAVGAHSQPKPKKPDTTELVMTKCWAYPLGEDAGTRITGDGTRIFVGLEHGRLNALSTDGKKLWTAELGGEISSNMVATATGLYLTTTAVKEDGTAAGDSVLYALSKDTGVTTWSTKLPASNLHFLRAVDNDVITVSAGGLIQSIDQKGAVRWHRDLGEPVEVAPAIAVTHLLIAGKTKVSFISIADGSVVSDQASSADVTALARLSDDTLGIGDDRGVLANISSNGGDIRWKFRAGGAASAILPLSDRLLLASHDNFVYLIVTKQGHVEWRRRLEGRILGIASFGTRWAVAESGDEHSPLLILDLKNGKTAAQIATAADESVVDRPYVDGDTIVFLTNAGAYGYSSSVCAGAKEGGKTDPVSTAVQKN